MVCRDSMDGISPRPIVVFYAPLLSLYGTAKHSQSSRGVLVNPRLSLRTNRGRRFARNGSLLLCTMLGHTVSKHEEYGALLVAMTDKSCSHAKIHALHRTGRQLGVKRNTLPHNSEASLCLHKKLHLGARQIRFCGVQHDSRLLELPHEPVMKSRMIVTAKKDAQSICNRSLRNLGVACKRIITAQANKQPILTDSGVWRRQENFCPSGSVRHRAALA